ncbi:NAD(P)-binding protein, partial [Infundibulicybe gibba]
MAENVLNNLTAGNIFDLRGVVAVVTGGGTGIGLMLSSTLVANGATVYIIGPKQSDLDKKNHKVYNEAAEKTQGRGRMHGIQGDIRLKSEAKRLAEEVGRREKYVTVLFNNAGILSGRFNPPSTPTASAYVASLFDGVSPDDFDNVFRTNAVGPYYLTFAFLPLLENWKNSSDPAAKKFVPQIIMTSSMNGWTKDSATGGLSYPYLFSKSAIGQATSSLAHELLPLGIRVNGIAPDELGISHIPAAGITRFQTPTGPPTGGSNRDMGSLALFLVANWFVNGETVLIDGGVSGIHIGVY